MASAFDRFRKYQKQLLVFVGVVCMVAFVFAGVECAGPGTPGTDPVVQIDGITYTSADIQQWITDRQLANAVARLIQNKGGKNIFFGPATQRDVVHLFLLAHHGQQLGIRISDTQINQFLSDACQGKVTAEDIRQELRQLSAREADLFRALRRELTAAYLMALHIPPGNPHFPPGDMLQQAEFLAGGVSAGSPSVFWEVYRRVNLLAQIEAIPVSVEEALGQVSTPDEQTIREFYEQYKDRLPDPSSPEPGFRRPHRARFQWIQIPYERFFQQALKEISEEEIARYYEENKRQFPYTGFETEPPESHLPLIAPPPRRVSQEQGQQSPGAAKAQPRLPLVAPPPAQTPPASSQPQSLRLKTRRLPVLLAAFQKGSESPSESGQQERSSRSAADKEAPGEQSAATGDSSQQESSQEKSDPLGKIQTLASELRIPEDLRSGPTPQYDPLWKVKDRIRRLLARRRANRRMEQVALELMQPLLRFSQRWTRWEASGASGPAPEFPDLDPLLKKHQLQLEQTPLVDARTLAEEYPLGKASLGRTGPQGIWIPQASVISVFATLGVYQVEQARDEQSNHYVFWKVEDVPSYVPPLEEVREEVIRAWKMSWALQVVMAGVKENIETIRKAGHTLRRETQFTGQKYLRPEPFSWWEFRPELGGYAIPEIPGFEHIGEEFMSTVFSMKPGEVAPAINSPRTIVYIIRLEKLEYRGGLTEEQAREQFLAEMAQVTQRTTFASFPYLTLLSSERRNLFQAWEQLLYRTYQVQWYVEPSDR